MSKKITTSDDIFSATRTVAVLAQPHPDDMPRFAKALDSLRDFALESLEETPPTTIVFELSDRTTRTLKELAVTANRPRPR